MSASPGMRPHQDPLVFMAWLAVLPPFFWAGNFVLGRALHADIPPLALSFWR